MNMKQIVLSLALALLLAVIAVAGEHYQHEEGGIGFTLPDGWFAEPEEDSIVVTTPDESLALLFWVPKGNTWEEAIEGVAQELEQIIQSPTLNSEGEEGKLNGMPLYEISGEGMVEGHRVEWSLSLLMARKPVIALGFAEPEAWKANRSDYIATVKSIKKQ